MAGPRGDQSLYRKWPIGGSCDPSKAGRLSGEAQRSHPKAELRTEEPEELVSHNRSDKPGTDLCSKATRPRHQGRGQHCV